MTIPLTGTGGHFTRVGKIGKAFNDLNTYRGNPGTAGTDWQAIFAQFATTDQDVVDALWSQLIKLQNQTSNTAGYFQNIAQATTREMAQDDKHLDDTTLQAAMAELIRQMLVSNDKVEQPTVSVAVTSGNGVASNNGDGVCVATVTDENALLMDYAFAETIVGKVNKDSQAPVGAATLGKEVLAFVGQLFTSGLDPTWPTGSGANINLNAITADDDGKQDTTLLTNGDWEGWASSTPLNWPIAVGAGTISKGTGSGAYRGTGSLKITGDGATLTELSQAFNTAGQTTAKLAPATVYMLNFWAKKDSGLVGGILELALVDSGGTILQDAGGNDLKTTITLSGLTTSFVAHNVVLRTPAALPALTPAALRIRLTTAATNANAVYLDDICLSPAVRLYNGGPYVQVFSGASKFVKNDQFNVTVSNNYSSAWQLAADRLYGMRDLGLILPSTPASGSVTILDSLLS